VASYNRVILMGNLTRDPEVKYTPSGAQLCTFGMAISKSWFDKATNQKKESVVFVDCTAWSHRAEFIGKYFTKGQPIHVEGELQLDQWTDRASGAQRSKITVKVSDATFCESKKAGGGANGYANGHAANGEHSQADSHYSDEPSQVPQQGTAEEDIPF